MSLMFPFTHNNQIKRQWQWACDLRQALQLCIPLFCFFLFNSRHWDHNPIMPMNTQQRDFNFWPCSPLSHPFSPSFVCFRSSSVQLSTTSPWTEQSAVCTLCKTWSLWATYNLWTPALLFKEKRKHACGREQRERACFSKQYCLVSRAGFFESIIPVCRCMYVFLLAAVPGSFHTYVGLPVKKKKMITVNKS